MGIAVKLHGQSDGSIRTDTELFGDVGDRPAGGSGRSSS